MMAASKIDSRDFMFSVFLPLSKTDNDNSYKQDFFCNYKLKWSGKTETVK